MTDLDRRNRAEREPRRNTGGDPVGHVLHRKPVANPRMHRAPSPAFPVSSWHREHCPTMANLKTFLVEDSPVIRSNLIAALEDLAPVEVVGHAESANDACDQLTKLLSSSTFSSNRARVWTCCAACAARIQHFVASC